MSSYSVIDVAAMLKVNEETVRRWIREGKLTATLKRGRGGSSIELEDIINFVNRTPRNHTYSAMKQWLHEQNIRFSVQVHSYSEKESIVDTASTLVGASSLGAALGGPVGYLVGGAVGGTIKAFSSKPHYYTEEQIVLLDPHQKVDATTLDTELADPHTQDKSINKNPDVIMDTYKPEVFNKDEVSKKIITEQKKLLRFQQELAQINAQISITEAEIEYYKLLLTENN